MPSELSGRRLRIHLRIGMLAIFALLLLSPQLTWAQGPGADNPPIVSNATVTPTSLPSDGGAVTITCDVQDDFGVAMVYADVVYQDAQGQSVQLLPSVIGPEKVTYSGIFNAPPNLTNTPFNYYINVQATDTNGGFDQKVAGSVEVAAQPPPDEPPTVSDPSVSPRQLTSAGGAVKIDAIVTDNISVSMVTAVVTVPGGETAEIALEPVNSSKYEGVFSAPANVGGTPAQYSVRITASDDLAQHATLDAGLVTVAAFVAPSEGRLKVSPRPLFFGKVTVGKRLRRIVVLRNQSKKNTAPISGVVKSPNAPFLLLGAGPGGLPFRLRAGEARSFMVEFRPTSVGEQSGILTIQRADGAQTDLAVRLKGRGR